MESESNPAGGVSIITYSNSDFAKSINSFILSDKTNSEGFGGIGPEVITSR